MTILTAVAERAVEPAETIGGVTITPVAAPTLRRSSDRKVAVTVRVTKGKQTVRVGNAFGITSGASCPGRTEACGSCYAEAIEKLFKASGRLVAGNFEALLACGDNVAEMVDLLAEMVRDYVAEAAKRGEALLFRIHWSGDYFSEAYAAAWSIVVDMFPAVQFWTYTRSFTEAVNVAPMLVDHGNLSVYLSVDRYNVDRAAVVLADFPMLNVAALGQTAEEAAELLDMLGRGRAPVCPENVGRMPLVVDPERRSRPAAVGTDGQGACVACGLCIYGRSDVRFSVSKR